MALSRLGVVIIARNEASRLPSLLADLARAPSLVREVLVVDGGSGDATALVARLAGARVLHRSPCRGSQLAEGVDALETPWLLLLHADVRLPPAWPQTVERTITGGEAGAAAWAFRLTIEGADPALRLVEWAVALRTRWCHLPYGDQGLLLHRSVYQAVGGIAPMPLMEDLEFSLRLRRHGPIRDLGLALQVDGRRWRQLGVWRTTLLNARLSRDWRRGVPAAELAARYQGAYQKAQRRSSGSSSQPRRW